jgi:hypothetical protein
MADEPRVIQPIVIMPPPPDPEDSYVDEDAERFIEDTTVPGGMTFTEWLAATRPKPLPRVSDDLAIDAPEG